MSPSSISKAINRLETDLQCQLFHRSTRKLSLSAEGNAYFTTTTKIIEDLQSCEETLKSQTQQPCGLLKTQSSCFLRANIHSSVDIQIPENLPRYRYPFIF